MPERLYGAMTDRPFALVAPGSVVADAAIASPMSFSGPSGPVAGCGGELNA